MGEKGDVGRRRGVGGGACMFLTPAIQFSCEWQTLQ